MTGGSLDFSLFSTFPLVRRATLDRMVLLWHRDVSDTWPSVSHSSNLHNQDIRRPHGDRMFYHMVLPSPGRRLWGFPRKRLAHLEGAGPGKARRPSADTGARAGAATRSWLEPREEVKAQHVFSQWFCSGAKARLGPDLNAPRGFIKILSFTNVFHQRWLSLCRSWQALPTFQIFQLIKMKLLLLRPCLSLYGCLFDYSEVFLL